jgi:hypothetical protein
MKLRIAVFSFLMTLLLVACAGAQATGGPGTPVTSPPEDSLPTHEVPRNNPLAPQPGDAQLQRGNFYVEEASLIIRESFPPQIALQLRGNLPTPCNQLRVDIAGPDDENRIQVDAYSVSDPNRACVQVLEPVEEQIELGTFPSGHYTVWVNGEMVGEFDS